jgi:hypothetical protein
VFPAIQEVEVGGSHSKASPGLAEKQAKNKRTGSVFQVVEHLPSKHQVLSSNSSTRRKKTTFSGRCGRHTYKPSIQEAEVRLRFPGQSGPHNKILFQKTKTEIQKTAFSPLIHSKLYTLTDPPKAQPLLNHLNT